MIGNSYGAMVGFLAAPNIQPDRILLCSLSPYFLEDTNKTTVEYRTKRFGKRRNEAMMKLSARKTAEAINKTNIQVTLLYGEKEKKEYPHLVDRVKESYRDVPSAKLVEVPNAPHSFRDPAYISGIVSELS